MNGTYNKYIPNRFHVAAHLSFNRSQMTSKCGKNKKVAHEAIAECVADILTTFWRPLWSIKGQMHGTWNLFVLYDKELNFVRIKAALFHVRRAKVGRSPFWKSRKKTIWRHLWSIQNEAISLVAVRWQRIVIGLSKSRHFQTWLECRFSWNENLQRRKNWAAKSTIL